MSDRPTEPHERPSVALRAPLAAMISQLHGQGPAAMAAKHREREAAMRAHLRTLESFSTFPIDRVQIGSDGIAWACNTIMSDAMEAELNGWLAAQGPLS